MSGESSDLLQRIRDAMDAGAATSRATEMHLRDELRMAVRGRVAAEATLIHVREVLRSVLAGEPGARERAEKVLPI